MASVQKADQEIRTCILAFGVHLHKLSINNRNHGKNQKNWVRKQEMATHLNILAWKSTWTEEPAGLQFMGSQSWTQLSVHTHTV